MVLDQEQEKYKISYS